MNILITRAKNESLKMAYEFEKLGHTAVVDPMIEITPIANWFADYQLIKDGIELIVFTSKYAIQEFVAYESQRTINILVVGKKSFAEAKKYGFKNIEAASGNARSLLNSIRAKKDVGKILYLSGENISLELDKILLKEQINCVRLQIYKTSYATLLKETTVSMLSQQKIDLLIICSALTAITFRENISKLTTKIDFSTTKLLVLSAKIAKELKIFNFKEIFIYNNNKLLTECDILRVVNGGMISK